MNPILQRSFWLKNFRLVCFFSVLLNPSCSPKVQQPVDTRPAWLKGESAQRGYYTGVGHSVKDGTNNYVQAAKKSALDDLVSQIKVTVSSTSILSTFEENRSNFKETYEQIIQTSVADELEEFELVGSWEDERNYWVYYRLSVARYREIKEEQKRNAVLLATDFLKKARASEAAKEYLQALGFYFQSFRSVEKYLAEAIPVTVDGQEFLLTNEVYASIQKILNTIQLRIEPAELQVNRRVNLKEQPLTVKATFMEDNKPVSMLPLQAAFDKGAGDVFPDYKTDESGTAKILVTKIASRELEQTVAVKVNIDAISGSSSTIYNLVAKTLNVPVTKVLLKVQRPVVYMVAEEKSLGTARNNNQLSNKLKNLLANNGFEFTNDKSAADLMFEVQADSERGSVSGSIYITFLTGVIKVSAVREGKEIYATTLDRIKGYGLDYERSSQDAYNKALETLEKERMAELLNTILQ
ncbi:MAG: LPP20 family lipoprotein [Flammeovirgaceae bacterium]|nr:MAG: LPP20 family lipoprotein [Flammeovirgaceae bacterium]